MKKLLFVPVALALVAPLSICATNLTDTANAQVPTTKSETLSPVAVLTENWYRYTAKDGSYSALFPGQPEETVRADSSVQVVYEDRANNRLYTIRNGKFRAQPSQNEIEKAFDAGVASLTQDGFTIINQTKINRQGVRGREVTVQGIKGSLKGMVMKVQMLIDPKESSMYMAVVAAEKGNLDFPEIQDFFNSISIQ